MLLLKEQKEKLQKLIGLLRIIPLWLFKPLLKKRLHKLINMKDKQEQTFWKNYFDKLVDSKTRSEEIASYSSMIDFVDRYSYTEADFSGWNGTALLLDSDTDNSFDKVQKDALRALFPQARIYTFKNTGHLSIITAREEYMKQVMEFFDN